MPRTFRENLILAMELRSMTGVELAKRTGVSAPTIARYRKGTRKPGGAELVAIAKVLGVDAESLIGTDVSAPRTTRAPKSAPRQRRTP